MNLLSLLKSRLAISKAFTKSWQEDLKGWVRDYEAEDAKFDTVIDLSYEEMVNKRYQFTIPLIFTNVEGMKSSMFDRIPDLLIKGRGRMDKEKAAKLEATYDYLVDKLDLETFQVTSAWWFILTGMTSSHAEFKTSTRSVPLYDESGNPMLDENGEVMTRIEYVYNDPILNIDNPEKTYWSPESEFTIEADEVPFKIKEIKMSLADVKRLYGKTIEADTEINVSGYKTDDNTKTDTERATVYVYYGTIPEANKGEVKDWEYDKPYYIVFTSKQTLYKEKIESEDKGCRIAKWYGVPTKFFGFGIGKILKPFQLEKSVRRGQQLRYGDVSSYPKMAIKNDGVNEVDVKALADPRENVFLTYTSEAPSFIVPPPLPAVMSELEQKADQDAQQATGMLDLSQGAQQSTTVKTATGQTIFAEAAEKRIRMAKKMFGKYYRSVVVLLFKLCQKYWEEEKLMTITDEQGNQTEISVSKYDLQDIDFDKDIDVDVESVTINKDILREQAIALYDKVKDDPLIDRQMVFKEMLKQGFQIKNPDTYLKDTELVPGMTLTAEDGTMFVIDESGMPVKQEVMDNLAQLTNETIPQDQPSIS